MACSASSAAMAQNCTTTQTGTFIPNLGTLAVPAGAASAALAGAIGNVNTAFLTQQGSAFVSAPGNPKPDQPGGGVWVRGVGGEVNLKTTSSSTGVATVNGAPVNNSTTQCANSQHLNFAGLQVGSDISRLNWNGWNVHLGTTAGYLGAKSTDNNGFSNTFEVPFFGAYVVATKGRFFADLMVRQEFYNINLSNAGLTYFNQPVGARGYSISASTGYNFDAGNGWFVEPSAGFIYANTSVDSFVNSGSAALGIPGTIATNNVISEIGRASVRVGKTIETPSVIWQPFASASVFHEFAGSVVSNYSSLPNGAFIGPDPAAFTQQTVTSRVGTYGQYSLGIAGQVVGTGWLGFARVDYRNGNNIDGWTGNAGIRYQFTPEMIASVLPTKVKAPTAFIRPTSWTGFYAGLFGGAAAGRTDIGFVGDASSGNRPWVHGGLGGIQLGYNRQINNWVFGVEGDIGAANIRGGRPAGTATGLDVTGASVGFSPAFFTVQDKTNWMATATGRVGYAYGRTLFYAKGGAAFEDSSLSVACNFGPTATVGVRTCLNQALVVTPGFSTANKTRVGWTLGYGTEFDLGKNWSAKAEYSYLSFGRDTALATDGTTSLTDRSYISQVKVGVNYRFSGVDALVAKN
ncbi:autotransporter domain-containing protein [Bradyrhizobium sediminis]|uniref:Autotransporter domain-containing protein n=1 Tax=Bradyrhizobium sediminis TaxID=2840469 RepID=A0A975P1N3_9BRAD|nr:autotransporter domain-containing protein [Bradyrhizobium sediminis]QWG25418.1 autotransporter domain-containing protein [Bradyrhizobium sediminis]